MSNEKIATTNADHVAKLPVGLENRPTSDLVSLEVHPKMRSVELRVVHGPEEQLDQLWEVLENAAAGRLLPTEMLVCAHMLRSKRGLCLAGCRNVRGEPVLVYLVQHPVLAHAPVRLYLSNGQWTPLPPSPTANAASPAEIARGATRRRKRRPADPKTEPRPSATRLESGAKTTQRVGLCVTTTVGGVGHSTVRDTTVVDAFVAFGCSPTDTNTDGQTAIMQALSYRPTALVDSRFRGLNHALAMLWLRATGDLFWGDRWGATLFSMKPRWRHDAPQTNGEKLSVYYTYEELLEADRQGCAERQHRVADLTARLVGVDKSCDGAMMWTPEQVADLGLPTLRIVAEYAIGAQLPFIVPAGETRFWPTTRASRRAAARNKPKPPPKPQPKPASSPDSYKPEAKDKHLEPAGDKPMVQDQGGRAMEIAEREHLALEYVLERATAAAADAASKPSTENGEETGERNGGRNGGRKGEWLGGSVAEGVLRYASWLLEPVAPSGSVEEKLRETRQRSAVTDLLTLSKLPIDTENEPIATHTKTTNAMKSGKLDVYRLSGASSMDLAHEMVAAGVVPPLLAIVSRPGCAIGGDQLGMQSLWLLTNLAAAPDPVATHLIRCGAVGTLLRLFVQFVSSLVDADGHEVRKSVRRLQLQSNLADLLQKNGEDSAAVDGPLAWVVQLLWAVGNLFGVTETDDSALIALSRTGSCEPLFEATRYVLDTILHYCERVVPAAVTSAAAIEKWSSGGKLGPGVSQLVQTCTWIMSNLLRCDRLSLSALYGWRPLWQPLLELGNMDMEGDLLYAICRTVRVVAQDSLPGTPDRDDLLQQLMPERSCFLKTLVHKLRASISHLTEHKSEKAKVSAKHRERVRHGMEVLVSITDAGPIGVDALVMVGVLEDEPDNTCFDWLESLVPPFNRPAGHAKDNSQPVHELEYVVRPALAIIANFCKGRPEHLQLVLHHRSTPFWQDVLGEDKSAPHHGRACLKRGERCACCGHEPTAKEGLLFRLTRLLRDRGRSQLLRKEAVRAFSNVLRYGDPPEVSDCLNNTRPIQLLVSVLRDDEIHAELRVSIARTLVRLHLRTMEEPELEPFRSNLQMLKLGELLGNELARDSKINARLRKRIRALVRRVLNNS